MPKRDRGKKGTTAGRAAAKPPVIEAFRILPAPKGPRTVSHRRIKEAVEKVFRERNPLDA